VSGVAKHSALGASSMSRWASCPGSVELCRGVPSIESDAAKLGTWVHTLIEMYQRGEMPAENFHRLDQKVQDAITLYTTTIFEDRYGSKWPLKADDTEIFIEQNFDLNAVYPGCYGRADTVMWNPTTRVLYVYDYKNGKSAVEVEDNWQLQYYALGALVTLKFPALHVEIVVVQPNGPGKNPVRRWRVSSLQLLDFEGFLVERAEATEAANAPLVPGRYCFFCPAHTFCPAKTAERLTKAIDSFDVVSEEEDDPFS